jgi:hypothetical protein
MYAFLVHLTVLCLVACSGPANTVVPALIPSPVPALPTATLSPTEMPGATASPIPSDTATLVPTLTALPTFTRTALPAAASAATNAPPVTRTALTATGQGLVRYFVNAEKHPKARCNDGTVPLFFYRRGRGIGADKWVIYFKGGGFCASEAACQGRAPTLTSSTPWQRRQLSQLGDDEDRADGILSNDPSHNPDFYNWNHVFMIYCSSDSWAGTRTPSAETFNWYFAGHYIVDAIMDALQDASVVGTPNLSDGTQILFAGSSAGGFGLHNNIDRLAKQFSGKDVRAFSDSAIGPVSTVAEPEAYDTIRKAMASLWQPLLDDSCVEANAAEPWQCTDGEYLIKNDYFTTPLFIFADQIDPVLLDNLAGLNLRDAADRPRVLEYAAALRATLQNEPAAYSTFRGRHVASTNEWFYEFKINGQTLFEILGNWYFNRAGAKNVIETPRPLR